MNFGRSNGRGSGQMVAGGRLARETGGVPGFASGTAPAKRGPACSKVLWSDDRGNVADKYLGRRGKDMHNTLSNTTGRDGLGGRDYVARGTNNSMYRNNNNHAEDGGSMDFSKQLAHATGNLHGNHLLGATGGMMMRKREWDSSGYNGRMQLRSNSQQGSGGVADKDALTGLLEGVNLRPMRNLQGSGAHMYTRELGSRGQVNGSAFARGVDRDPNTTMRGGDGFHIANTTLRGDAMNALGATGRRGTKYGRGPLRGHSTTGRNSLGRVSRESRNPSQNGNPYGNLADATVGPSGRVPSSAPTIGRRRGIGQDTGQLYHNNAQLLQHPGGAVQSGSGLSVGSAYAHINNVSAQQHSGANNSFFAGSGGLGQANSNDIQSNGEPLVAAAKRCRAVAAEEANPGFRAAMEDGYVIRENFGDEDWAYYAVYDGHGGRTVVDYTLQHLHDIVLQECRNVMYNRDQMRNVFERSYQVLDNQLRQLGCWHCGTTSSTVLVNSIFNSNLNQIMRTLFCAHVGDSRAAIVTANGCDALTNDHKGSDPAEYF